MTLKDENETHLYKFPTLNFIMKGLWLMKQTWYNYENDCGLCKNGIKMIAYWLISGAVIKI